MAKYNKIQTDFSNKKGEEKKSVLNAYTELTTSELEQLGEVEDIRPPQGQKVVKVVKVEPGVCYLIWHVLWEAACEQNVLVWGGAEEHEAQAGWKRLPPVTARPVDPHWAFESGGRSLKSKDTNGQKKKIYIWRPLHLLKLNSYIYFHWEEIIQKAFNFEIRNFPKLSMPLMFSVNICLTYTESID